MTDIYGIDGVKCIKKDVIYNKLFELNDVEIESFIDNKGKVISKYCGVIYKDKYYKVNKSYKEMSELFKPLVIKGLFDKSNYNEKNKTNKTITRRRTT